MTSVGRLRQRGHRHRSASDMLRPAEPVPRKVLSASVKVAGLLAALALWEVLGATGALPSDSFPTLPSTAHAIGTELGGGDGWRAIGETLAGWGLGFVLGSGCAIVVGVAIGLSRFAFRSSIPVIEFMKTIPVIAILPIAILIFGGTLKMEYTLVAFGVFWPLTIQVVYGVRSIDPVARDTATMLGVRGLRRFRLIVLPSASPFIATGLRIAAAVALILAVIAELIGGASGLGREILVAEDSGQSALPIVYALIVITGAVGLLITVVMTRVERRLLRWHERFRPLERGIA
jgi:ABC-type nitrate/sulfonate/bicarbonate transport system permease component